MPANGAFFLNKKKRGNGEQVTKAVANRPDITFVSLLLFYRAPVNSGLFIIPHLCRQYPQLFGIAASLSLFYVTLAQACQQQ